MEHSGFFQFFHRHAPFLTSLGFVRCSGPYLHPNQFYSSTQLSAALHFAGRFAGSPSVFYSLWPLFGETFQMRKEQTPWHCLFWCFRKYSQMKWWNEWNQGCPISCRCPGTRSLAFLWGAVHLGKWLMESFIYKYYYKYYTSQTNHVYISKSYFVLIGVAYFYLTRICLHWYSWLCFNCWWIHWLIPDLSISVSRERF